MANFIKKAGIYPIKGEKLNPLDNITRRSLKKTREIAKSRVEKKRKKVSVKERAKRFAEKDRRKVKPTKKGGSEEFKAGFGGRKIRSGGKGRGKGIGRGLGPLNKRMR